MFNYRSDRHILKNNNDNNNTRITVMKLKEDRQIQNKTS